MLTCIPLRGHAPCMSDPKRFVDLPEIGDEELAEWQPRVRAMWLARLEEMWAGIQADINSARDFSERGVDPRLPALQLQIAKLAAQLMQLSRPAPAVAEPEPDPVDVLVEARALVAERLDQVAGRVS